VLDITDPALREELGVTEADLIDDDLTVCQDIADAARSAGFDGIPSLPPRLCRARPLSRYSETGWGESWRSIPGSSDRPGPWPAGFLGSDVSPDVRWLLPGLEWGCVATGRSPTRQMSKQRGTSLVGSDDRPRPAGTSDHYVEESLDVIVVGPETAHRIGKDDGIEFLPLDLVGRHDEESAVHAGRRVGGGQNGCRVSQARLGEGRDRAPPRAAPQSRSFFPELDRASA
jgi:hypothetical protein